MRDIMTAALYAWGQHRNPARRTSRRVAFAGGKWGMSLTMFLLIPSLLIAVVPASASSPSMTVTPSAASRGEKLLVTGSNVPAGTQCIPHLGRLTQRDAEGQGRPGRHISDDDVRAVVGEGRNPHSCRPPFIEVAPGERAGDGQRRFDAYTDPVAHADSDADADAHAHAKPRRPRPRPRRRPRPRHTRRRTRRPTPTPTARRQRRRRPRRRRRRRRRPRRRRRTGWPCPFRSTRAGPPTPARR